MTTMEPACVPQVLTLSLWGPQTDRADIFHDNRVATRQHARSVPKHRIDELKCMEAYRDLSSFISRNRNLLSSCLKAE